MQTKRARAEKRACAPIVRRHAGRCGPEVSDRQFDRRTRGTREREGRKGSPMGHSTLTLKMGLGRPRGERDTPKPLSAGDAGSSSALSPPDDVRAGL